MDAHLRTPRRFPLPQSPPNDGSSRQQHARRSQRHSGSGGPHRRRARSPLRHAKGQRCAEGMKFCILAGGLRNQVLCLHCSNSKRLAKMLVQNLRSLESAGSVIHKYLSNVSLHVEHDLELRTARTDVHLSRPNDKSPGLLSNVRPLDMELFWLCRCARPFRQKCRRHRRKYVEDQCSYGQKDLDTDARDD